MWRVGARKLIHAKIFKLSITKNRCLRGHTELHECSHTHHCSSVCDASVYQLSEQQLSERTGTDMSIIRAQLSERTCVFHNGVDTDGNYDER